MKKIGMFFVTFSIVIAVLFGICSCGKKEENTCSHRDANDDYLCDLCTVDFADEREHFNHTMDGGACTVCGMPESTDGLEMELTHDGKSYVLVGIGECKSEAITVGIYNGLDVSSVANYAFDGCTKITSVKLCNSVEKIGYKAFQNCTRLETLTLPRGLSDIASDAFLGCAWLSSVTIPDGVRVIGSNAFAECRSLMSVYVGKGVTEIEDGAFTKCSNLSTLTFSEGVTELGEGAFSYCEALMEISLPKSLKKISEGCFEYCKGLKSVSLGGVEAIPYYCFRGCASLETVNIGRDVKKIESASFGDCPAIQAFNVDEENEYFSSLDGSLYNKAQTTLIKYTTGSKSFKFVIPESVTTVYSEAFQYCNEITMLIIHDSVKYMYINSFEGCRNLVIYCSADAKPKEWQTGWNSDCRVIWGYKGN